MTSFDVTFFFENRRLSAKRGESIAKALFDAGVRTLSYSVKYRRPRGIHCARGRCVMCHMEVDGVPGVPTCITPVTDGMRVQLEDFRPFFAPLLVGVARRIPFPAGFYYRMFSRPAALRTMFMRSLRKMAGVGRVIVGGAARAPLRGSHDMARPTTTRAPKPRYDVVIVGAGLSGMAAALAAARDGVSLLLVDEYAQPGGHSLGFHTDGELSAARDKMATDVSSSASIDFFPRTTAQAFYPPDTLLLGPGGAVDPVRYATGDPTDGNAPRGIRRVRASSFVFATGAYDVVPTFDDSDTPGVFGSRAIRLLIERDGLKPGSRATVFGTGTGLAELARYLMHHGIEIAALIDAASPQEEPHGSPAVSFVNSRLLRANGGDWLSSVTIGPRESRRRESRIRCDLLCLALPGQGAYELAYQAGFNFEMSGALQETKVMRPTERSLHSDHGIRFAVVGDLAGDTGWREKITEGKEAGTRAAQPLKTPTKD